MNEQIRKRELIQFKALVVVCAVVYAIWMIYGVWSGNYDGPIIVGFISGWAVWYIRYVKLKAIEFIGKESSNLDWYSLPLDKYINFPVLALSLIIAMFLCVSVLVTLNVFNNAN